MSIENGHEITNGNGKGPHATELVETTDEDGTVHYFEKLNEFEMDGKEYALLVYQGTDDEEEEDEEGYEEEFVVMRLVRDEEGILYESLQTQEEFDAVVKHLESQDYDVEVMNQDDEQSDG